MPMITRGFMIWVMFIVAWTRSRGRRNMSIGRRINRSRRLSRKFLIARWLCNRRLGVINMLRWPMGLLRVPHVDGV